MDNSPTISHASLAKLNGEKIADCHRISLGGVDDKALMWFLTQHPEIDRIILCLDNDDAGKNAVKAITEKLKDKGYDIMFQCPLTKDFNADLQAAHKKLDEQVQLAEGRQLPEIENDMEQV